MYCGAILTDNTTRAASIAVRLTELQRITEIILKMGIAWDVPPALLLVTQAENCTLLKYTMQVSYPPS